MSNQFNSDEDLLARLVCEAGNPSISPDPQYAEKLRATILERFGSEDATARGLETFRAAKMSPVDSYERSQTMNRIAKLAVAASILVAFGIFFFWMAIGSNSTNLAFADIAKALDSLRTATYDFTSEIKNPLDGTTTTINSKGYFLAPALERVEMSMAMGSTKDKNISIMILDCLAAKGITLVPELKEAMIINISTTEKSTGGTANMFEMIRRLVQEGSSGSDEKVESLGKKEIDGNLAIGFRTSNKMGDMSLWADPQTARLVRVDFDRLLGGGHAVMSNFRYDMDLDPSLFSLEPPAGYTVQTQTVAKPVEEDLVNVLRFIAEYNDGTFPNTIGMNEKTFVLAMQAEAKSESERLLKSPEVQKLRERLKAKYGEDKDGFNKEWMKEWTELVGPSTQQQTQQYISGMLFYMMLLPENDSHYVGKDVKLDAPDRPILWYKPTGADKYRVIYADLSVKEMTAEEVKQLP